MANDDRYGRYGQSGSGRDYERHDGYRGYGSESWGLRRQNDDRDRDRGGFGAYSQGGSYSQSGYREQSRYRDEDRGYRSQQDQRRERDNERYDNYDADRQVAIDETNELIASNKVEGTRVYNRRGDRLGTVYNFMVNKRSGRVEYAVMSFGGFLGLGERYYPLPWNLLTYDERQAGYVVDLDERQLERAPSFGRHDNVRFDRGYGEHVSSYYGVPLVPF